MELYIAGGVGNTVAIVSMWNFEQQLCRLWRAGSDLEDPYPRLTQQQQIALTKFFLLTHMLTIRLLYHGLQARISRSLDCLTKRCVSFLDLSKNISLERICSNGEGFDKDLAIVAQRSLSRRRLVSIFRRRKIHLVSGDYTEDASHVCDQFAEYRLTL